MRSFLYLTESKKIKPINMNNSKITIETKVNADVNKVWNCWTQPQHITKWNFASDDWHCPKAENDLRAGGKFSSTMAAKDGSMSFDFAGVHDEVSNHKKILSTMGDGRKMSLEFHSSDNHTKIVESFEPENENPVDMQRMGWQAILDNFKKYVENN